MADPAAEAIQRWLQAAPPEVKRLLTLKGPQEGKSSKRDVNYRPADTPDESCGTCAHYSDGSCDVVAGRIDAGHVSDLYERGDDGGEGDE